MGRPRKIDPKPPKLIARCNYFYQEDLNRCALLRNHYGINSQSELLRRLVFDAYSQKTNKENS